MVLIIFLEIDADNDGCNDTDEEEISNTDSDRIAGAGVPTVNTDGLVTSITNTNPKIIHLSQNDIINIKGDK